MSILLNEIPKKIRESKAVVSIMGLGRVGLPLAVVLARSGLRVVGIDLDDAKLLKISKGELPYYYPSLRDWLREVVHSGMLRASSQAQSSVEESDIVIITVGTPIGAQQELDYSQLHSALQAIARTNLRGKAIIMRSTSAPGTLINIVLPLLSGLSGLRPESDFALAACPERIREGQAHRELYELPEIVGGVGEVSNSIALELFKKINPNKKILITTPTGAELAKLFTNIHLYVNFALANEYAIWAEMYGEDAHQIIQIANDGFPRVSIPKPGFSGGPCFGKDGFLLDVGTTFSSIVSVAWKMNEAVPQHVALALVKRLGPLFGKKVAVLGVAFKADSDDLRLSPSVKLVEILKAYGATVLVHDPYVKDSHPLKTVLENPDAVVLATNHSAFKGLAPTIDESGCKIVFDVWGMYEPSNFKHARYGRFGSAK